MEPSNENRSLGFFLESAKSAGRHDSEGFFTLSHSSAAKKLSEFSLPRKFAWVSKLVQAAVRWGCSSIAIDQTGEQTTFLLSFTDLDDIPTEDQVVERVLAQTWREESALDDFGMSLGAMVAQANLSFLLVLDADRGAPRPIYAGKYFSDLKDSERSSVRFRRARGMTLTVSHICRGFSGHHVGQQILREIAHHCYLSPVPIEFKGEDLTGLLRRARFTDEESLYPLLVRGLEPEERLPALSLERRVETKTMTLSTTSERALRSHGGDKGPFGAVLLVVARFAGLGEDSYAKVGGRSTITWVRAGVVVDTTPLPWNSLALSCQFLMSAEGLPSDLTGFQLLESTERAEREMAGCRGLAKAFQEEALFSRVFESDRDKWSDRDDTLRSRRLRRERWGRLLARAAGIGVLTFLWPPVGTSALLAAIAYSRLVKDVDDKTKLDRHGMTVLNLLEADRIALARTASNWTVLPPL